MLKSPHSLVLNSVQKMSRVHSSRVVSAKPFGTLLLHMLSNFPKMVHRGKNIIKQFNLP